MPERITIIFPSGSEDGSTEEFTRILKDRATLTNSQAQRLAQGLARSVNSNDSEWPRKGGGVNKQATGHSRTKFKGKAIKTAAGWDIHITNTARAVTKRKKGRVVARGGEYYARFPEAGIPNRRSAGRLRVTLKRTYPRVVKAAIR